MIFISNLTVWLFWRIQFVVQRVSVKIMGTCVSTTQPQLPKWIHSSYFKHILNIKTFMKLKILSRITTRTRAHLHQHVLFFSVTFFFFLVTCDGFDMCFQGGGVQRGDQYHHFQEAQNHSVLSETHPPNCFSRLCGLSVSPFALRLLIRPTENVFLLRTRHHFYFHLHCKVEG